MSGKYGKIEVLIQKLALEVNTLKGECELFATPGSLYLVDARTGEVFIDVFIGKIDAGDPDHIYDDGKHFIGGYERACGI